MEGDRMDNAVSRYRAGDIIADKYRVERVLGVGGMGVVLAATHIELGERRAIKLMHASGSDDPEYVTRFLREARALARLRGEHIARVHDVGRLGEGVPYMVIEYLEGTDLAQVLEARTRLPVQEAVLFLLQVCEALAEAHVAGIVHRDLKPQNLFLTRAPDGSPHVKVIDFGIAKTTATDTTQQKGAAAATKTGAWMGSPLYMSPEQIQSARDVDARSDIWALGAILYEFLTGKQVWPGTELMEIFYHVTMTSPAVPSSIVPNLPPGLDAIVIRCLEKDRNRRYASVAALAEALEVFATDEAKSYARRAARIVLARQSTIPNVAESSGEHHASFVPTVAAPPAAMQTPIPIVHTPAAPFVPVPNDRAATSGSGGRTTIFVAMAVFALLVIGAGAYAVRGNAEEANASRSNVRSEQFRVDSTNSATNVVGPSEPKQVVENRPSEVVPEKQEAKPTSVQNISPTFKTEPAETAGKTTNPAVTALPTNTVKTQPTVGTTASPVVKQLPDKPRPGIIPR